MRDNSKDKTIERSYIQKYQFLISDYELVKQKRHPKFRFVSDFYKHHNTCRQTFLKYYGCGSTPDKFNQSCQRIT